MKVMYQLFQGKNLLIMKVSGNYSIRHFKAFAQALLKELDLKYVTKMLADYRDTHFDCAAIDELDRIIKIRTGVIKEHIDTVFLVNHPLTTVAIHLLVKELPGDNTYCSTLKSAIKLLGLAESEAELDFILRNLEKSI